MAGAWWPAADAAGATRVAAEAVAATAAAAVSARRRVMSGMRVLLKSDSVVTTHAYRDVRDRKKSPGTGWLRSGQLTTCHAELN
ncbi:hypothetical protein EASAB2608_07773 [Streptomyces sp. EAS-AB2608]|uniref:Secreted protein n=1 Tax=Streptomyces bangladeshensis TaxID=295352 RepID=A0ABN3BWR1_9ACTN|nr:hypothetical protein EASAB2608_07773 [Streptomyces sp. EAS-AB2608]